MKLADRCLMLVESWIVGDGFISALDLADKLELAYSIADFTTCETTTLRRQLAELRQLATDLLSVAEQLPALQPGSWEFEVVEEAHAALARGGGEEETE